MTFLRARPGVYLLALAILGLVTGGRLYAHSQESAPLAGKLAPLLDGLGDYHYPVSNCSPSAQRYFDQGLKLVHAFQFWEAIASFREAATLDPDCPMVHWGEALAIAPNPNNRYLGLPDDKQGAGAEAIRRALRLAAPAPDKERALIEALNIVYDTRAQPDRRRRDLAYVAAMSRLFARYPDDPEVGTQYGAALMTASPWDYWTPDGKPRPGTDEAAAAFERVLKGHPDHPGANHLYIHLLENSQHPEFALPHAERLAQIMRISGHVAHMPSHIYLRTGEYQRAIESNVRSHAADQALLAAWGDREFPMSAASYSASANVHGVHAHDFLNTVAVSQGNFARAIESARAVASFDRPALKSSGTVQGRFVKPWLTLKRFGRWDTILAEPAPPEDLPFVVGMWHYVRGSALAAGGKLSEAERELAGVRQSAEAPGMDKLKARVNPASKLLTLAGYVLQGEILAKRGNIDRALVCLDRAVRIEDGLLYIEPPDWGHPARHSVGAILLQAGRPGEAEVVYWEDLRRNPENGWSLYGAWQSLVRQGDQERAAEVEKRFRAAWLNSDVTLSSSRF
jgi:tetratricopeptide (TPR) repeat protein